MSVLNRYKSILNRGSKVKLDLPDYVPSSVFTEGFIKDLEKVSNGAEVFEIDEPYRTGAIEYLKRYRPSLECVFRFKPELGDMSVKGAFKTMDNKVIKPKAGQVVKIKFLDAMRLYARWGDILEVYSEKK